MATRKIAPALAAGCTVVIKPAELTPLTTLYFAKLLEDAGLPEGVVNVITTSQLGRRVRARSSATRGCASSRSRARRRSASGCWSRRREGVLRTSMELGGNAPFVVFEDADLDKAVDGAMVAKFRNIGQACTAANRFIVHRSVADEFARRVTERGARRSRSAAAPRTASRSARSSTTTRSRRPRRSSRTPWPAAPFGGWKMSGLGREGGAEGIHEYLQTKYTLTPA